MELGRKPSTPTYDHSRALVGVVPQVAQDEVRGPKQVSHCSSSSLWQLRGADHELSCAKDNLGCLSPCELLYCRELCCAVPGGRQQGECPDANMSDAATEVCTPQSLLPAMLEPECSLFARTRAALAISRTSWWCYRRSLARTTCDVEECWRGLSMRIEAGR